MLRVSVQFRLHTANRNKETEIETLAERQVTERAAQAQSCKLESDALRAEGGEWLLQQMTDNPVAKVCFAELPRQHRLEMESLADVKPSLETNPSRCFRVCPTFAEAVILTFPTL